MQMERRALMFDDVLRQAGGAGRWQLYIVVWISKIAINLAFFLLGMIFLGMMPEHRCADGYPEGVPYAELPEDTPQCRAANTNATCTRWSYQEGRAQHSMVVQWDLVCDRRPLLALIQSMSMFGGLAGALSAGSISDRFGRRPTVLVGSFLYTVAMLAAAAARELRVLLAIRFFCGLGTSIALVPSVVLVLEILTPEWRMLAGLLLQLPYAVGVMVLSGVGYALPVWWHLQLLTGVIGMLYFVDFWLLPESPRWLVMAGRLPEAAVLLQRIGRFNGSPLPDTGKLMATLKEVQSAELSNKTIASNEEMGGCRRTLDSLFSLVRTPRIRMYTIATLVIWLASGLSYFGLAFEVTQLSNNIYVGNCISGLLEAPACLLPWFAAVHWGRRPACIFLFLLGAATILPAPLTHNRSVLMTLGLVGKFGVTGAFCLIYIYTPEYMPTTVRTAGQSAASVAARVGSMVAPFIVESGAQLHTAVPTLVFGGICVLAAALVLLLPETAGRRLPETVAAVELGDWRFQRAEQAENLRHLLRPQRQQQPDTNGHLSSGKDTAQPLEP